MKTLAMLYGALADTSRLRIVGLLLRAGPLCVCDIERVLGFTQTKVSRHLGHLRTAGIVTFRREKTWKIYTLAPRSDPPFRALCSQLGTLLAHDATALGDLVRLRQDLNAGCCSTYANAGQSLPSRLQLTTMSGRMTDGSSRDKRRSA